MATADCGCSLTLLFTPRPRGAPRTTKCVPLTDEDVTLTKRTSAGTTQHHVLCGADTCPTTLTSVLDVPCTPVARKTRF